MVVEDRPTLGWLMTSLAKETLPISEHFVIRGLSALITLYSIYDAISLWIYFIYMFDVIWDPIQRAQNSLCRPLMLNVIFLFSLTYSYKQDKQMDVLDYPLNFNAFHCIVKF